MKNSDYLSTDMLKVKAELHLKYGVIFHIDLNEVCASRNLG